LFRDWQRTHTQSSAKAMSRRQQMDVWSCLGCRGHQPWGKSCAARDP